MAEHYERVDVDEAAGQQQQQQHDHNEDGLDLVSVATFSDDVDLEGGDPGRESFVMRHGGRLGMDAGRRSVEFASGIAQHMGQSAGAAVRTQVSNVREAVGPLRKSHFAVSESRTAFVSVSISLPMSVSVSVARYLCLCIHLYMQCNVKQMYLSIH
jgi:hypothetical protein